jgi:hypothetical protein
VDDAWRAVQEMNYRRAIEIADDFLREDADDPEALTILGRVQLGTGETEKALKTYTHILKHKKFSPGLHAEAALVLDNPQLAQTILLKAMKKTPDHPDLLFLAAVTEYQLGHIPRVTDCLLAAIESGLDWNDEDPITLVVEHCLSGVEFMDLECIYLDCQAQLFEAKTAPQNRWFGLNMPIYELYTASTPDKQKKRGLELLDTLLGKGVMSIAAGQADLKKIFTDFSTSEQDARFGLEGLKLLETNSHDLLARQVLALQLEHLKEFAVLLAIPADQIAAVSIQSLTVQLPLRLSTGLLILYAISTNEDRLTQLMKQEVEPAILAALIAACFSSFYSEIGVFKKRQQPLP